MTLNQLHKKLWKVFSEYIRLRDADANGYCRCISCGGVHFWKRIQAGHYVSKGVSHFLKYDENNVHAQCGRCNLNEGNTVEYRNRLITKIGIKAVELLEETMKYPGGLSRDGATIRIREYQEKVRALKKQKDVQEL